MKLSATTTPTTVSSTSTTNLVVYLNPPAKSAADLTAWSTLTFPATFKTNIVSNYKEASLSYSVKVGLFGFDLTTFMTDCKTTVACNYENYSHRYDGFSMGFYWVIPSPSLSAALTQKTVKLFFCIKESYSCITE
jgi:hypothetical protein